MIDRVIKYYNNKVVEVHANWRDKNSRTVMGMKISSELKREIKRDLNFDESVTRIISAALYSWPIFREEKNLSLWIKPFVV